MKKELKVSIVTATYNSENVIRGCLDSFFGQSWPHKELILVDGASTDRTIEIAKEYECDALRIISEPDNGMYYALNKGLDLINGDVFGILNSDDRFHDHNVLVKITTALRNSKMVHGHVNYVHDHQTKKLYRAWAAKPYPKNGFRTGWMPCHTSFFVHRSIVDKIGKFDTRYSISADYDWMIKAIESCPGALHTLDDILIDMQIGGMSTKSLSAYIRHNLQSLEVRQRTLGAGFVDYALFAKPLRKIGQLFLKR